MVFLGHVAQPSACTYLQDPSSFPGLPMLGRVLQGIVTHHQLPLQLTPPPDGGGPIISAAVDYSHAFPLPDKLATTFNCLSPSSGTPSWTVDPWDYNFPHPFPRCHMEALLHKSIHDRANALLSARRWCSGGKRFELAAHRLAGQI